jgi:hypothetical protein
MSDALTRVGTRRQPSATIIRNPQAMRHAMTTYALCIGIDEYEKPLSRLRCARKDADDLARVLREARGFEAQSLKPSAGRDKLSTEDVFDALDAIGAGLSVGDSFVLSFSGHGAVEGDEQYFFLSGARRHLVRAGKVAGPGVLAWSALREHTAQEQWSGVQRIFILDACREPLLPSKRLEAPAAARFDGRVLLARNLVPGRKQDRLQARKPDEPPHTVLHACSDRQLAFELPDSHNSVFTAALMQTLKQRAGKPWHIDKDYLHELRECMEKVRAQAGLDEDKFVQAPAWNDVPAQVAPPVATVGSGNAGATAAATGTGVDVRELDTRLWRLSCAKNTVAGYEDYIRHAPPGAEHVDEAADRIEELLAREQDATSWQQAQAEQPEGLQARAQHFRGVLPRLRSKQARAECEKVVAALEKQIAAARPQPGQVLKDSELSPELVVLPRGRFTMGSPTSEPERDRDEGPQPVIRIDYDLAVGRYPVTQREWTAVMGSNPSYPRSGSYPVAGSPCAGFGGPMTGAIRSLM